MKPRFAMREIVSPVPLILLGTDKRARDESCPSRGDTCPICNGVWEVGAPRPTSHEGPIPFLVPYCIGFVTGLLLAVLYSWIF